MNDHGLSREIPPDIKRAVRKRCGFGCVVCGGAIYEYEHFDPEFKDAKEHRAEGIALLCPTDHRRKEKKLLSKERYLEAIARPKALETNSAYTEWETSNLAPIITIGNKIFKGGTSILKIDDELLLGFKAPEEQGAPPRLYFRFFDNDLREVFSIIDNQIQVHSDSFDIETTAENWIVRSKLYKIDLHLQLYPPDKIVVKQINFRFKKWGLTAKGEEFSILYDSKPCLFITGTFLIEGPCLFDLSGEGKIETKNMNITAIDPSISPPKSMIFKWPLYFYVDAENDTPIEKIGLAVILGSKLLPIFSTEESARQPGSEHIPSKFKLKSLESNGFIKLLEQVVLPRGITHAILDPDLSATTHQIHPIELRQFIETNKKKINDDDPCPCGSGKTYEDCHKKI